MPDVSPFHQSDTARLAEGVLVQRRGHKGYVVGLAGFYVVNPKTNIAVGAYTTREQAQAHADKVHADYPFDANHLVVVEIA